MMPAYNIANIKCNISINSVCNSKRVCGILITMRNNFTCMLLSIYMPGNNYYMFSGTP